VPNEPRKTVCSFCGKPDRETGPQVEGPGDVYLCEACAYLALSAFAKIRNERLAALDGLRGNPPPKRQGPPGPKLAN
jgi:ATP-dependent Clp protease ATP-binding subunit ClpX